MFAHSLRCWNPDRRYTRTNQRVDLNCVLLEARLTPTTNLILDFGGGITPLSSKYVIVGGSDTVNLAPFVAFDSTPFGAGNRTEQIRQIVSGVRQDYADFDVNVIWDDRGVNSPFFHLHDTVVVVTDDKNTSVTNPVITPGVIGISPFDLTQSEADVALVFIGSVKEGGFFPPTAAVYINATISVISHESGHSFGESHVAGPDSQHREIMAVAAEGNNIDSRFTPEVLDHLDPELGVMYSERGRLQQNLGLAKAGTTTQSQEILTNQTLLLDTPRLALDAQGIGVFSGSVSFDGGAQPLSIDFAGDGDAFQIDLQAGHTYAIRQRAAGSMIDPILTLYDSDGDFITTGSQGTVGGVSLLTFTPTATDTYFVVANTSYSRTTNGALGTRTLGAYNLEITPTWFEIDSVAKTVRVPGDNGANTLSAARNTGGINITSGTNNATIPAKYSDSVELTGGVGNDQYKIDLSGGALNVKINDIFGSDSLTVSGTSAADTFAIQPTLITTAAGAKLTLSGLDRITVDGLAGNDLFTVTPGSFPILINGGSPTPPTKFGDSLKLTETDVIQTPSNLTDGRFNFPISQPVIYTGIESFDANLPVPARPPKNSFAVGAGEGSLPSVSFYNNGRDVPTYSLMAYDQGFRGGVRVATGDVDGDGIADLITAAGPGGGPHVQVFSGKYPVMIDGPAGSFFAYDASFTGGVFVAAGDVNGDGKADIITGADAGGGPHVRVFDGATRKIITEFFAFDAAFHGGVRVAAGDVNGDGKADIICAAGPGGGPHVKVFDGTNGKLIREFFAFDASFHGGVFVSAADVNGDGKVDIATGAGEGGGAVVSIWDGASGGLITRFNTYPPSQPGTGLTSGDNLWSSGVRVALADTDGDGVPELYVGPGRGKTGNLKGYSLIPFGQIWSQPASDPTFLGGMYIGS
jgi:FG-GAP-like repeat/FG-GAP repeat